MDHSSLTKTEEMGGLKLVGWLPNFLGSSLIGRAMEAEQLAERSLRAGRLWKIGAERKKRTWALVSIGGKLAWGL